MNEIDKTNLSDQTKFRLNEICKIENYFNLEINQRKLCSKKLSKYVSVFDYIDMIFIVLSAATGIIKKFIKNNKKQKEKARKNSYVG